MKKHNRVKPKRSVWNNLLGNINIYLLSHGHALLSSLGRLTRSPVTFSMTVAVLAITISLASGFYLFVANLQQMTHNLEASNQISVYLNPEITVEQGQNLARELENYSTINQIQFISKQQGLDDFKHYSGFGEALDALANNPLPHVIQVLPVDTLSDEQLFMNLVNQLEKLPEVDFVQVDMQWLKRLQALMSLATRGVFIFSSILALAILFITGNTIRLELQNRKQEVLIEKLVGATHGFIQRPYIYAGFWYGFIAGWAAWLIITLIVLLLQYPLDQLSALYDEQFSLRLLSFKETLLLLIISASLGMLGAWLVLNRQLQQLKPD